MVSLCLSLHAKWFTHPGTFCLWVSPWRSADIHSQLWEHSSSSDTDHGSANIYSIISKNTKHSQNLTSLCFHFKISWWTVLAESCMLQVMHATPIGLSEVGSWRGNQKYIELHSQQEFIYFMKVKYRYLRKWCPLVNLQILFVMNLSLKQASLTKVFSTDILIDYTGIAMSAITMSLLCILSVCNSILPNARLSNHASITLHALIIH